MISATFFSFLPLLLGMFSMQAGPMQTTVTRLVVQDEVILRVPLRPRPPLPRIKWVEKKGMKCIPLGAIRGALQSGPDQVDFVLADRSRVRAHFDEDCPALDFYGGMYLEPEDDRLCVRRDSVHSRIGGSCRIERFKKLVPKFR